MSTVAKKVAREWEIGQIMETMDYDRFSFKPGNREIRPDHVKFLKTKMGANYLVAPIMCNTELQILDGQHRYEVCKELGLPIRYYITEDMDAEEIAAMNNAAKRWKPEDYANVYTGDDYRAYRTFRNTYPHLAHTIALLLLAGGENKQEGGDNAFRTGYFKVKSYSKAIKMAELLEKISEYTKEATKRSFVYALLHIMNHNDYDEKRLMRKIRHKANLLRGFSRTDDYIKALQDMYNWMEPTEKKVSFERL